MRTQMLKNVDVVTIGGIVRNTSVRIENGKISAISDALPPRMKSSI